MVSIGILVAKSRKSIIISILHYWFFKYKKSTIRSYQKKNLQFVVRDNFRFQIDIKKVIYIFCIITVFVARYLERESHTHSSPKVRCDVAPMHGHLNQPFQQVSNLGQTKNKMGQELLHCSLNELMLQPLSFALLVVLTSLKALIYAVIKLEQKLKLNPESVPNLTSHDSSCEPRNMHDQ